MPKKFDVYLTCVGGMKVSYLVFTDAACCLVSCDGHRDVLGCEGLCLNGIIFRGMVGEWQYMDPMMKIHNLKTVAKSNN